MVFIFLFKYSNALVIGRIQFLINEVKLFNIIISAKYIYFLNFYLACREGDGEGACNLGTPLVACLVDKVEHFPQFHCLIFVMFKIPKQF